VNDDDRKPWMKWYPTDWRADPRLRMCSLAARGLWVEIIGYCHEAEPYGHLVIAGCAPSVADLASLVGAKESAVRGALDELEAKQVCSRDDEGRIYSRRMVRDKAKADADKLNGKRGGNPRLRAEDKQGVNPPDKAHMPEARSQIPEDQKQKPARKRAPLDASPPEGVLQETWGAWLRHKGSKQTADADRLQRKQLSGWRSAGHDVNAIVERAVAGGWKGLFAPDAGGELAARKLAAARNMDILTGKVRDERLVGGTAERMDRAPVFALPGGIREPGTDDVEGLGPSGGARVVGG
jgi:hypothetical protein